MLHLLSWLFLLALLSLVVILSLVMCAEEKSKSPTAGVLSEKLSTAQTASLKAAKSAKHSPATRKGSAKAKPKVVMPKMTSVPSKMIKQGEGKSTVYSALNSSSQSANSGNKSTGTGYYVLIKQQLKVNSVSQYDLPRAKGKGRSG